MTLKKEIILYTIVTFCSLLVMGIVIHNPIKQNVSIIEEDVESLSSGENDDVDKLECSCSLKNSQSCAVDNWGSECASGKNVECWRYNQNCS